jgi:hypothetical protein
VKSIFKELTVRSFGKAGLLDFHKYCWAICRVTQGIVNPTPFDGILRDDYGGIKNRPAEFMECGEKDTLRYGCLRGKRALPQGALWAL